MNMPNHPSQTLCILCCFLAIAFQLAFSQSPESFFPANVGDRWDYQDLNSGQVTSMSITRDSIGAGGSHNLFYNGFNAYPLYRIDTAYNVFWMPQDTVLNFLRYKLAADSCETWTLRPPPNFRLWAWVANVESASVFFQPTVAKVFRYAPGNPCSPGSLEEDRLASRFGLVYKWREPNDITYLRGCIINGDTFGILTSVPQTPELPREYLLKQNYPNPFNPTTTIEFNLPEAAIVSVRIYDILGRSVATIGEGTLTAGVYRSVWDASELPSGVYFCRLQARGNFHNIKMLLTK